MKYFVIMIVTLLLGLNLNAQDEIIHGSVRYDGFQKVTKGYYWKTRPEARMVYEGSQPPGVQVFTLESDYYLRFIDSEHNNFDRNYIIVPKGEKVYTKNGKYYLAICGNEIEYLRPVDQVKVVEVPVKVKPDTVYLAPKKDTIYLQPERLGIPTEREQRNWEPEPEREVEQKVYTKPERRERRPVILSFSYNGGYGGRYGGYVMPPVPPMPNNGGPVGVPGHGGNGGGPVGVPGHY